MAVQIRLRVFGQLQSLVDATDQTLELPADSTVVDLFQVLSARYGPRFEQKVMETRHGRPALQAHVLVFVNDEQVERKDQASRRLGVPGTVTEVSVFAVLPCTGG